MIVEFRDILNTANKVHQIRAVTGMQDSSTTLAAVVKLCSEANDVSHSLNLINKWNIPQGHQADAFGLICFNCDAPDHTSNKCPLPHQESRVTMAKEVRVKTIGKGHSSGGCGCGRGRGDGCGGRGGDRNNTRGKWGAAKGSPTTLCTNTSMGDGVKKKNGKWMMYCKLCR